MNKLLTSIVGVVGMLYGLSSAASPLTIDIDIIGPFHNPDSVMVDGREWAQLDIFEDISWNDINAVCPQSSGGVCDGLLEDVLLTDWVWASVDDVNELFNYFLRGAGVSGSDLLDGPDFFIGEHLSQWARNFYDAGFRVSPDVASLSRFVVGPLRDLDVNGAPRIALLSDQQSFGGDSVRTDFSIIGGSRDGAYSGAWFFRSSQVPVSSTAFLSLVGFLSLVLSRRTLPR